MKAIEESAKEPTRMNRDNPMAPAQSVIKAGDADAFTALGLCIMANERRLFIN